MTPAADMRKKTIANIKRDIESRINKTRDEREFSINMYPPTDAESKTIISKWLRDAGYVLEERMVPFTNYDDEERTYTLWVISW